VLGRVAFARLSAMPLDLSSQHEVGSTEVVDLNQWQLLA
jgi:hypothetical protein